MSAIDEIARNDLKVYQVLLFQVSRILDTGACLIEVDLIDLLPLFNDLRSALILALPELKVFLLELPVRENS